MNDIDTRIRDAVGDLVRQAPAPVPFDQLDTATIPAPQGERRSPWLAVAAAAIALAGIGAVTWVAGRDDATPPATQPTPSVVETVAPPPTAGSTPGTTPHTVPDTVPGTSPTTPDATPAATAPDERPSVDDTALFPLPGEPEVTAFTAIAPSGSIDAAPGDIVAVTTDGDLWLHAGAFDPAQYGRPPQAPLRLVDLPDPRGAHDEGPGPNVVDSVAGFVNGALVYADCCEPVSGNLYAVSDAETQPTTRTHGLMSAADRSGRRWASVDPFGVTLLDYDTGRGHRRHVETGPDGSYQQFSSVVWSPDDTELWALGLTWDADGNGTAFLARYRADATLTELGRRELGPLDDTTYAYTTAGRLPDGTVVLTELRATGAPALHLLGNRGEPVDTDSGWNVPDGAYGLSVSPDGTTLAYVVDDVAYLHRAGQEPVEWGRDLRMVSFVTTPPQPTGRQCEVVNGWGPLDPAVFADLDGDGLSERVTMYADGPSVSYGICGSALAVEPLEQLMRAYTVVAVDVEGDGRTELFIGSPLDTEQPDVEQCGALYRLVEDARGARLTRFTESRCIGDTTGFGCVAVGGVAQPVFYERDGLTLTATLDDGTVLGTHTYSSEDELRSLFDLAC